MNTFGGAKIIFTYQVLIGELWVTINPDLPLSEQTCGMRAYRQLDEEGNINYQSKINS